MEINKKRGKFIINVPDRIVSMLYIKRDILASSTYYFCTGKQLSKYIKNTKERISEFKLFREEFEKK